MVNQIDHKDVANSFSDAAKTYDDAAFFQRIAGDRLFERLDYFKLAPKTILDIGSGTGHCTRALKQKYPSAQVVGLDIAQGMVDYCRQQSTGENYICADALEIPLESNSQDLIFSNLTFQWIEQLDLLFKELHRVLKPNGLLLFTSLGPDTLFELKTSWKSIDEHKHVNDFMDMHHLGDAMLNAAMLDPVVDNEAVVIGYDKALELMRDLKNIGAHNVDKQRRKGLTSPAVIRKLEKEYQQFKLSNGELPATYELVYGHAFGREEIPMDYHEYGIEL
ncbi:malonyl-ACP O-methyltransferase BioC [Kangiella sp. HZ709]|uniref:malonyl-ACP O-methyltransferase BioC n=1 Tax=Kangiella sp. HZ709 TaxID=2666328 RepID=UPI0012AF044F|nr:malonyl-ACP O-methyltransferase BioC [Kangiella sp. HZ709]MRX28619.1 malonyl-ACP O-methyltransferase BioC [Kangiella sp. HZ709]